MIKKTETPNDSFWQDKQGTVIWVYWDPSTAQQRFRKLHEPGRSSRYRPEIKELFDRPWLPPDYGYYKTKQKYTDWYGRQYYRVSRTFRAYKWLDYYYRPHSNERWEPLAGEKVFRVSRCHWLAEGNTL